MTTDSKTQDSAPSEAQKTGRGGLAIAAGKVYFMVLGLGQQIALKAVLGLSGFGAYSTASSVASISYNPIVQTAIQGVSREVSGASEAERPGIIRSALAFHFWLSVTAAILFFLLADAIAGAIGAPHIAQTLRILSVVVFMYGLYAPLVGVLNGYRRFLGQAGIDMTAATLRTAGLIGGAWYFSRDLVENPMAAVEGANWGFAGASLFILFAGIRLTGLGKPGERSIDRSAYLRFLLPVLGGQLLLNLLFRADALLLRRFASEAAIASGSAAAAADPLVGAYTSAQLFCFLPYQLLMSVTFVLFPLLAEAKARGDHDAVRAFVMQGVRLSVLLTGLMVSVLLALPQGLIFLVFGADAAELGQHAMRPLAIGLGCFALLGVMISALNGLGAAATSLKLTCLAVVLVIGLTAYSLHQSSLGPAQLERAALATMTAMVLSALASGYALFQISGAVVRPLTLVRVLTATGAAAALSSQLFQHPESRLATLVGAAATGSMFLLLLTLSRELTKKDLELVTGVLGRSPRR